VRGVKVVALGSGNQVKKAGLLVAIKQYSAHWEPDVLVVPNAHAADVPAQPRTLGHIFRGAQERARQARQWTGADLGVGIESGVFELQWTGAPAVQMVDVCACVVCDRDGGLGFGLSSGFVVPPKVASIIRQGAAEMNEAVKQLGIGEDVGHNQGLIGIMTNGRMKRADQVTQAAIIAIAGLSGE